MDNMYSPQKFQLLIPQADGTLQTREASSLTSPTHVRTNAWRGERNRLTLRDTTKLQRTPQSIQSRFHFRLDTIDPGICDNNPNGESSWKTEPIPRIGADHWTAVDYP